MILAMQLAMNHGHVAFDVQYAAGMGLGQGQGVDVASKAQKQSSTVHRVTFHS